MKKVSYIFSSLVLATAMTACQETWDDNPKLDSAPIGGGYENFLNVPEMAEQYIVLTKETQNGVLALTCSQPDYGFAAAANYTVQLSLSNDFTTPVEADCPASVTLSTVYHNCAAINITNADIYAAMTEMLGIEDATKVPTPYYPLYIRLIAEIQRQQQATGIVPGTTYYSNVVSIKGVSVDFYQPSEPGFLYLIGQPQGWTITDGSMFATETGAGTGVYKGTFKINAGDFMFRFYSKLGDWESNSVGSQVEDTPIDISLGDDGYAGPVVWGKGSWSVPGWEGGTIDVVIDLNDMTISFVPSVPRNIYLIGAPQGWDINSKAITLTETGVATDIYTGSADIDAGQFQFRFYTALGDWETNSIGSQIDDAGVAISMSSGSYSGICMDGKGTWLDSNWAGGNVSFEVNLKDYTVTFTTE